MWLIACCHAGYVSYNRKSFSGSDVFFVKSASERLMRKTSSFSRTGPSTSSITWKRWLLWSKWILPSSKKNIFMSKTYVKLRWGGKPVCCCKLSLYAKGCGLFSAVIEMTRHIYHVSALFLSNRGLCIDFREFIHACSIISETNRRRMRYTKEISWRRGSEWGYFDNTKHFIFWFCSMKQLNFRHFNTNSKKFFETNFFQKEAKTAPKMPILFRLV